MAVLLQEAKRSRLAEQMMAPAHTRQHGIEPR